MLVHDLGVFALAISSGLLGYAVAGPVPLVDAPAAGDRTRQSAVTAWRPRLLGPGVARLDTEYSRSPRGMSGRDAAAARVRRAGCKQLRCVVGGRNGILS